MMPFPFTVYRLPLSVCYPFTVIHEAQRLMANSKSMVNGKWLVVNGSGGAA